MAGFLNLGSLMLGLVAWALPVFVLMRGTAPRRSDWATLSVLSVSACVVALYLQILYSYHLVRIQDWSALMDTAGAVALVSGVLLWVTIALNAAAVLRYRNKTASAK